MKKLLVGLITLVIVVLANVALWVGFTYYQYKDIASSKPWTPGPTSTATINVETAVPQPSQTANLPPDPTNTFNPTKGCIHSITYWADHEELWPDKVTIGNYTYTKEAIASVYGTLSEDPITLLFIQLHTAFLNAVHGADYSRVYQTDIDAANWLMSHPPGSVLSQDDQQICNSMKSILEQYNTGGLGPALCIEPSSTPTPTPTEPTSTPEPSTTSTPTPVYVLPSTRTNTPGAGQPHPHNTPQKTKPPPTIPPDTQAPPPPTSIPPTHPPPPTEIIKPTQAPTKPS